MGIESIFWHTVHTSFLNKDSLILDLGAHRGTFSKEIVKRFGGTCVAIEPTPGLFDDKILELGIKKLSYAIMPFNGTIDFHLNSNTMASSARTQLNTDSKTTTVQAKKLEDLVEELGWNHIDLLKCDIEGAEIGVFQSCSDEFLKSIGQITVEFHDFCNITSTKDVKSTIKRFKKLGFTHIRMSLKGHHDTWLINRNRCKMNNAEFLYAKYFVRNWHGLKRILRKIFLTKN